MATTTPNYGWPVPTSTDLVKNGATAIEALGDAIDGAFVDLKGGTTGQVLAKATNTDLDYAWVTQDDANAIQNSIVNAKGDLIGASANDVPAILSVGANGETIVADDSTSTGLRYTAGTVSGNPVLNSAFQIWQRGISVSATAGAATYTADRWQILASGNATTTSRQLTGDTTNLPNIQYCARVQRNAGQTNTTGIFYANSFETINSIPYAGKTITISYYARKGADFSAASSNLSVTLYSGTGTDQSINGTYTGVAAVTTVTQALTTTWQRFTGTGTVSASATEIAVSPFYTPTGTAGANDYFEITGVQIDIGSVALPFRTYAGTIQGELAACQRYYYRNAFTGVGNGTFLLLGVGQAISTTSANIVINFPVTMRGEPQAVDFAGLAFTEYSNAILPTVTSMSIYLSRRSPSLCFLQVVASAAALTLSANYYLTGNGSGTSYVGLSAEL